MIINTAIAKKYHESKQLLLLFYCCDNTEQKPTPVICLSTTLKLIMSEPSPIPSDGDTTKTRRLVPQHSLTKQDLGSDNARSSRPSCDTPKKPGNLF
jgi:hypothetical protein